MNETERPYRGKHRYGAPAIWRNGAMIEYRLGGDVSKEDIDRFWAAVLVTEGWTLEAVNFARDRKD